MLQQTLQPMSAGFPTWFLILAISLLVVQLIILFILLIRKHQNNDGLTRDIDAINTTLKRLEDSLREDFRTNRSESAEIAGKNREELLLSLRQFDANQQTAFNELKKEQTNLTEKTNAQLENIPVKVAEKLSVMSGQARADALLLRDTIEKTMLRFQESMDKNQEGFNNLQREKFTQLENKQADLIRHTEAKLEAIRTTVEEKLEKTLSERLNQSFETVGKQLMAVQQGLGEMQVLATDVGGLKKVLSNVKLRGGIGEVQLAMLLEQTLAPNQYDANVITKKGSNNHVEFAIKMPGHGTSDNDFVYLPIDAKFPQDAYEHLINAYENAIPADIDVAARQLDQTIRKMAQDIREKYIDPPHTTDFAILFLPFEGIYAEVIRRSTLVDNLRTEHNIVIAGPTTFMALLNSLQMGFRTLALQQRSAEVWQVLSKVKSEFENFGGLLVKAQKNIQTGLGQLDDVVGKRTRAIQRSLKNVESLPASPPGIEATEAPEDNYDD